MTFSLSGNEVQDLKNSYAREIDELKQISAKTIDALENDLKEANERFKTADVRYGEEVKKVTAGLTKEKEQEVFFRVEILRTSTSSLIVILRVSIEPMVVAIHAHM